MKEDLYVPRQRPGKVQAIGIMNLVDGVLNLLWSATLGLGVLGIGLGTFGLGCLCAPLALLPLVVGVLGIVEGIRQLSNTQAVTKPARWLAVLQIINVLSGNVISLGIGIASLVLYSDREVEAFYAGR